MDFMTTVQEVLGENTYVPGVNIVDPVDGTFIAVIIALTVAFALVMIVHYVYTSLTLYKTAQRLNVDKPWLAWIPVANIYLRLVLGDMSPYFLLLYVAPFFVGILSVLPFIGIFFNFSMFIITIGIIVVTVITYMRISEKRGYDKLFGLMAIYPLTAYILMGILAWGKKEG
jgi:hypothetical protein